MVKQIKMTQVRKSTIIDEDAHYEIRDLRKRCGKIRPEETTSGKKTGEVEIKPKRRTAISFTEHKIEPMAYACQVCFVLDGLYNCTICKRFTCIRDTYKVNELHFCKLCSCNGEYIPYINALDAQSNKPTMIKKIKEALKHAFSFEWLYKKE